MKIRIISVIILSWLGIFLKAGDFTVLNRNGQKLPVNQKQVKIDVKSSVCKNGVKTIEYRLTSLTEQKEYYRIRCSIELSGEKIYIFDGIDNLSPATGKHKKTMLMFGVFPLAAAWSGNNGIALAAGAEDHHSFLNLTVDRSGGKSVITEEVSAALLKKGAVYQGKFHIIHFSPKYGERDAMARYYQLYPKRFRRNPEIDPRIYGISASYASWFRSNPEWVRFSGAEWEWCVHVDRHWGDIDGENFDKLSHENYVETLYFSHRDGRWDPQKLSGISKERFQEIRKQRLANGYYCAVANAYYTTGVSRIHNALGKKFKDSLATANPQIIDHGYDYAANVFAFPETSWGKEIMRMFKTVAKNDELSAFAFDIPLESEIYRGDKLYEMSNVGFDQFGPGVVRAVANSKLCEQINQITAKYGNYKLGTAINVNGIHQINNCFYADNVMAETNPWQYAPPWPKSLRYAIGEKGATFWEGFNLKEFNANEAKAWSKKERNQLIQDLARYVAHRSFLYGVTYPSSFTTEYLSNLAPAMQLCNQAGYKVVPGMKTQQREITLTRYGCGDKSLIAVCNTGKRNQSPEIEIFPNEFQLDLVENKESNPLIFAGFLGGTVYNSYKNKQEFVSCFVPPLRINILEAIGTVIQPATGKIEATWKAGFQKAELTIYANKFQGKIKMRKRFGNYILNGESEIQLNPDEKLTLIYLNKVALLSDNEIINLPLLDHNFQPRFTIYYSSGVASRDMAERIQTFFRELGKSKNSSFKLKVELAEKNNLPPYTIVLSLNKMVPEDIKTSAIGGDKNNLVVSAGNRDELSSLTRTILNVLNKLKYPEYVFGVKMDSVDHTVFKTQRFD